MRVDLLVSEAWEDLNGKIFSQLELPENTLVKCYRGLAHAIFETCAGASYLFSHKKSLGIIRGQTPAFAGLIPGFHKEGYQVQNQTGWPIGNEKNWVDGLKKDTNFVLYASDNPVSGEIFPWEVLDDLLNEKKIFSVRVSHSDWLKDFKSGKKTVRPYSVHIVSIYGGLSLAICGEKVKTVSVVADKMPWDFEEVQNQVNSRLSEFLEDKKTILEFEKNLPLGWQALLNHKKRLFDRSLIYHSGIHGGALIEEISNLAQCSLGKPGEFNLFETTNLARWNSIFGYFDWWDFSLTPEILRGMIVIDARALQSQKNFTEILNQAVKNIVL